MNLPLTDNLPPNARTWVYQSARPLTDEEAKFAQNELKTFISQWTSHKVGVAGAGYVFFNRFIVLMADEEAVSIGGCSIDSSVRFIKDLQTKLQTDFFNRLLIAFRTNDRIESAPINDFLQSIQSGKLSEATILFDNTILTKQDLITRWQIPFNQSNFKKIQPAEIPFAPLP